MTSLICWSDYGYYDGLPLRSDWTLNVTNLLFCHQTFLVLISYFYGVEFLIIFCNVILLSVWVILNRDLMSLLVCNWWNKVFCWVNPANHLLPFLHLSPTLCVYRGSKWCHIVPPARRQEEESGLLLSGIWRPQDSSSSPPPADERQGEGLGKRGHCGVGWSHRGPRPRGHGQGKKQGQQSTACCYVL